nr:MAG TPA: hypothetical protein [Caudoviricetes sp.]DAY34129.1 MAG TPA: hypothetical protein [Caudoviricetes sp.]
MNLHDHKQRECLISKFLCNRKLSHSQYYCYRRQS